MTSDADKAALDVAEGRVEILCARVLTLETFLSEYLEGTGSYDALMKARIDLLDAVKLIQGARNASEDR